MSASTFVARVDKNSVRIIKDIESSYRDILFSDGCGYISKKLLDKAAAVHNFSKVSALQIRFAGFKGTLMCHMGLGKSEAEAREMPEILFRNSMKKFDDGLYNLSVIRCATYSPAYLNRQVILILNHIGVPDELFETRNEIALEYLNVSRIMDRLEKQINKCRKVTEDQTSESMENSADLARKLMMDIKLFFGPSRQFKQIFCRALLMSTNYIMVKKDKTRTCFNLESEPIFKQILKNMVLGQA